MNVLKNHIFIKWSKSLIEKMKAEYWDRVRFWTVDGRICNCCSVQKRSNLNLMKLLVYRELHGLNPPNTRYYITSRIQNKKIWKESNLNIFKRHFMTTLI